MIDQGGIVTQVMKGPNGPEMRAARFVAGPVPKAVLERYVGEYEFMPKLSFVVRLRGETLSGQSVAGGPEVAHPDAAGHVGHQRMKLRVLPRGQGFSVILLATKARS